jgi:hypothetical protein
MAEYWCGVCLEQIDPAEGDIHSLPNGEDCHAECCPECETICR